MFDNDMLLNQKWCRPYPTGLLDFEGSKLFSLIQELYYTASEGCFLFDGLVITFSNRYYSGNPAVEESHAG